MKPIHVIKGETATASSQHQDITGAKKVTLFVKSTGTASFSAKVYCTDVEGNSCGEITYNKWIKNVTADAGTSTAGEEVGKTYVAAIEVADASDFVSMSPEDAMQWIEITATESVDGVHDAWLLIEY